MTAKILDGLLVSQNVRESLKNEIMRLTDDNVIPGLATILIGDDPPSIIYVNNKQKTAKSINIKTFDYRMPENISQNELIDLINQLNIDTNVHGILIQLPLPSHLNKFEILNRVDPKKDVDGLTIYNAGLLLNDKSTLIPCTPLGIMELLKFYKLNLDGLDVVVINRSNLIGKPLISLLLKENATVTICHSRTKNLEKFLNQADMVISAVGNRKEFVIKKEMIKENSILIDVGTSRINGLLLGDFDFKDVSEKASYITPVPGGVGPMTISMLLRNTVQAAKNILIE